MQKGLHNLSNPFAAAVSLRVPPMQQHHHDSGDCLQVHELAKTSTGTTNAHASNKRCLIGCSVAFVLLSAFDAGEGDSVPAGLHCGRYG